MDKHACKLCSRSFANGRALGGHMRSHMIPLVPSTSKPVSEPSSASTSSPSSEDEEGKGPYYGLRENPKKSIRLVDPEFFSTVDAGSVVQDGESETETSKHPVRKRSKRSRRSSLNIKAEPESEPLSSVSDTTTEEDVALCLMMLSRDMWMREPVKFSTDESDDSDSAEQKSCSRGRSRFQCGTCRKVFRSYQALGGHRASHRKIKDCSVSVLHAPASTSQVECEEEYEENNEQRKIHECPICFRVFDSGQALGGHKRSHLPGSSSAAATAPKVGDMLIDLNLPAPLDDDDVSQVEQSALSDADFVVAAGPS